MTRTSKTATARKPAFGLLPESRFRIASILQAHGLFSEQLDEVSGLGICEGNQAALVLRGHHQIVSDWLRSRAIQVDGQYAGVGQLRVGDVIVDEVDLWVFDGPLKHSLTFGSALREIDNLEFEQKGFELRKQLCGALGEPADCDPHTSVIRVIAPGGASATLTFFERAGCAQIVYPHYDPALDALLIESVCRLGFNANTHVRGLYAIGVGQEAVTSTYVAKQSREIAGQDAERRGHPDESSTNAPRRYQLRDGVVLGVGLERTQLVDVERDATVTVPPGDAKLAQSLARGETIEDQRLERWLREGWVQSVDEQGTDVDRVLLQRMKDVDAPYFATLSERNRQDVQQARERLLETHARRKQIALSAGQCVVIPECAIRRALLLQEVFAVGGDAAGFAQGSAQPENGVGTETTPSRNPAQKKSRSDEKDVTQESGAGPVEGAEVSARVLCVGDDDLVSLALASVGFKATVWDVDEGLLGLIDDAAARYGLHIETQRVNLLDGVSHALGGRDYDAVLTDPMSNRECFELFLSRGLSALGRDGVFFCAVYPPAWGVFCDVVDRLGARVLQRHHRFNRYVTPLIARHDYVSDWVQLDVSQATPIVAEDQPVNPSNLYREEEFKAPVVNIFRAQPCSRISPAVVDALFDAVIQDVSATDVASGGNTSAGERTYSRRRFIAQGSDMIAFATANEVELTLHWRDSTLTAVLDGPVHQRKAFHLPLQKALASLVDAASTIHSHRTPKLWETRIVGR